MLSRLVCSKNNLFFAFLVAGYIFDVILYDYIDFTSADELMALFLLFFSGLIINERRNIKEMIPLFVVLFFYSILLILSVSILIFPRPY
mgnify:CR=1 FL=1